MAQINVKNLYFGYDGNFDNVFENASFFIDTDWKLGLIGRNGKGKTTFMNLLLGKYQFEGSIETNVKFEYFPYVISDEQMCISAIDFIEDIKFNCESWKVIRELGELNETAEILYRPFNTLSSGERTKIMLAVLFSDESEFLLIDEPTNHLDQAARECVKAYLGSKKSFILVSHDRDLLDACIDHVLILNRKTIEVQKGNFSSWWDNKQKMDQFVIAENEKHKKKIKKLKQAAKRTSEWSDKNERTKIGFDPVKEHDRFIDTRSFIGSKTKKLQSRVKQVEKRIDREIEEKEGLLQDIERAPDLKLEKLVHYKKQLITIKDYGVRYAGSDAPVFSDLSFNVFAGDRIALHGENGCGKSTLIKMILKKTGTNLFISETDENGLCEIASGLIVSYINQDTSNLAGSIYNYCDDNEFDQSIFFAILRQLNFERNQFSKKMQDLSDGQKKKVLIASSIITPAHLYIWDEPLNYIDVFSCMQLENLLLNYQPTMLFVEHDVRFRENIATKTIEL